MVVVSDRSARVDLRGRFGRVAKIRITDHDAYVMVFVELYNHDTGGSDIFLFEPHELQRRTNAAATITQPVATDERHIIAFETLKAAA